MKTAIISLSLLILAIAAPVNATSMDHCDEECTSAENHEYQEPSDGERICGDGWCSAQ